VRPHTAREKLRWNEEEKKVKAVNEYLRLWQDMLMRCAAFDSFFSSQGLF
jgi:hypothetical protein